jgi:hypothetical protein
MLPNRVQNIFENCGRHESAILSYVAATSSSAFAVHEANDDECYTNEKCQERESRIDVCPTAPTLVQVDEFLCCFLVVVVGIRAQPASEDDLRILESFVICAVCAFDADCYSLGQD